MLSRANASYTCTPRLLPSSSVPLITTDHPDAAQRLWHRRASNSDRLSAGVVTSTVGSRWFWALRSPADVSPLRAGAQAVKR
jgi:hypothetical protein